MSLISTIRTGHLANVALMVLPTLLISCGGSSSGVAPSEQEGQMEMPGTQDGMLPDFRVLSLSTSPDNEMGFNVQATIMNDGDIEAAVPRGWFMISTDSNIIDNYHYKDVRLEPQTPGQDILLQPGESAIYTASTSTFTTEVSMVLGRAGTHYGRLWLNPDLSKRFINPETSVRESHTLEEKNYENNLSEIVSFESIRTIAQGPDCTVDAFEENDTIAQATPITVGVTFNFNSCDELFEVLSIDLEANTTYVLQQKNTINNSFWGLTVVDPDSGYLARELKDNNLVTTTKDGQHHIVASFQSARVGRELEIEVIKSE